MKIKIQSISDIITNSSSEVFVFKAPGFTVKEIQDFLTQFHDEHCIWNVLGENAYEKYEKLSDEEQEQYDKGSGLGGMVEVFGPHDRYKSYCTTRFHSIFNESYKDYDKEFVSDKLSYEEFIKKDKEILDNEGGEDIILLNIDRANYATINLVEKTFEDVKQLRGW